jgi:glycosyltransferase involved in cell wall biosynthesis
VQVLPGIRFPEIINDNEEILTTSFILPDEALAEVAQPSPEDMAKIRQQLIIKNAIDSFVIVIPVYNIEKKNSPLPPLKNGETYPPLPPLRKGETKLMIENTLNSIEESLKYFQQNHPHADKFNYEIVIVDDASQDNTETIVKNLIKNKPHYRYFKHKKNRGQAAARNTGVKNSTGKAILFCDDDDLFLPEHIFSCITAINQTLPPDTQPIVRIAGNYPAAVKTAVKMQDKLHPYWHQTLVNVLVLNTCIRREAHNLIEGFPEEEVFRLCSYGNEDYAYSQWLTTFFNVVWLETETVEYIRYPGSHFDRQLLRFQEAPGKYQEAISEDDTKYLAQIEKIIEQKKQSLQQKISLSNKAQTYLDLGNQAFNKQQFKQAINYYHHSLFLNPDLIHARYNLGVTYLDQEEWEAATIILKQVTEIEPNYAEAFNNLGNIFNRQNDFNQAIKYYRQAINLRHQFPDAHFNLGMTLLQIGEFKEGWKECEWRWQRNDFFPFQCPHPQWDGSDISDKTILIHTEQGAGDSIQFIRYLPLLANKCKKVLLCCPENLITLFKTVQGIAKIYPPGDIPTSEFQTYLPLLSLPYIFDTNLENIPSVIPYLGKDLSPSSIDAKLKDLIKQNSLPNIGIVWAGSDTHKHDKHRSCSLFDFLPILKLKEFNFYSLQKGNKASEIAQLPPEINITDLSNYLGDYADTAKVISKLDLIISVDTSVAHLAGALGEPVWVLLDYNHDWRWLLNREDTPWYPTMKLFKQQTQDDWVSVFEKLTEVLNQDQIISN